MPKKHFLHIAMETEAHPRVTTKEVAQEVSGYLNDYHGKDPDGFKGSYGVKSVKVSPHRGAQPTGDGMRRHHLRARVTTTNDVPSEHVVNSVREHLDPMAGEWSIHNDKNTLYHHDTFAFKK